MATTLTAGDVAIVGKKGAGTDPGTSGNRNNDDSFAFVVLRDIEAGTVINFTDKEWAGGAGGGLTTGEGVYTYTASGAVAAGTVITVRFDGNTSAFPNNMSLPSSSGDQIIAFQGNLSSPTILDVFQDYGAFETSGAGVNDNFNNSTELPPGIVQGQTALALGAEPGTGNPASENVNWTYVGPTSGSKADLLTAIHTASNWVGVRTADDPGENPADFQNSISFPSSFNVGAPAAPAEIDIRGGGVSIVDGDTTPSYADATIFGGTAVTGGTVQQTFTILNQGGTALSVGAITVTGANAGDFTVTTSPSSSVAPSGSTTFTVTFNPSASGLRTATINVANSDSNENPYNFDIAGSGVAAAPTSLAAGDIAFVGFNGDATTTTFGFVLLKPVVAGTVIKFTDAGWDGSALRTTEHAVQWVAPTDMAFGTVVQFDESNLGPNFQSISDGGYFTGGRFHLESGGDQIFAYTGAPNAPNFLSGLHTDSSAWDTSFGGGPASSLLPPGLTDGATAISFGNGATNFYSGVYSGSTTGDQAALLAKINNEANWTGSAAPQTLPSGPFGGGAAAPEIDVQYQVGGVAIADGDATPLQTEGTQFDAQNVDGASQSHVFVIRNLGDQTLNLGAVTVTGANASDFTFTLGSSTVGASQSTTLTVTFNPSAAGARTATINIPSNDANEANYDFAVRGLGRDPAQTLSAGDVAFAAYDSVSNKFAFVLMTDVAAGTSIKFTNGGWTGTTYRQGDGAVEWTAAGDLRAGTVVTYDGALPNGGIDWTSADTGYFTAVDGFNPQQAGDQIIAYQGTASAGGAGLVNLAALHYDKSSFDTTFTDTISSSLLPTGLVDGQTAISFGKPDGTSEWDYGRYNGPTNLPFAQQLAALNNEANWIGSDGGVTFPTGPIGQSLPPVLDNLTDAASYTEGAAAVALDVDQDAIVTDGDSDVAGATVTITNVADGDVLAATVSGGVTAAYANGVLTLSGTASAATYQAILRSVTYQNTGDDPTASNASRTIETVVTDVDGNDSGTETATVAVTGVNDAPTLTATGTNPTFTEDGAAVDLFFGVAVSAVEAGQTISETVIAVSGVADGDSETLALDGVAVELTDGTSGTTAANGFDYSVAVAAGVATITVTRTGGATSAQIQALIDGLGYANASQDPTGPDRTVTVSSLTDDGGTANGGDDTGTPGLSSTVAVQPVNDAPSGADATITLDEDGSYTFAAADFGFSDATGESDAFASVVITALPTAGALTLSGAAVSAGDEIAVADIPNLVFTPAADGFGAGYASLTFQVRDDGGTANGGVDLDPSANTITFDVDGINDEPTVSATALDPTFTEGGAAADLFSGVSASTVETGQSITRIGLTVSGLADGDDEILMIDGASVALVDGASGTTTNNGLTYAVTLFGATAQVIVSAAGGFSAATAQAVLDGLAYSNLSDDPQGPTRSISIGAIEDDGGTANGGDPTGNPFISSTVTIAPVNDAPSGADATITLDEDGAHAFTAADFGFSDPGEGDGLQSVVVTTLPTAGTLTLSGASVSAGDEIAAADISNLLFTPAADANGAGYATLTFQVRDDGGTDNGGADLDPTPRTLTFDVDAVNDDPTISGLAGSPTYVENGSAVILDGDVVFADVELDALAGGSGDYGGAYFYVTREVGGLAAPNDDDLFSVDAAGASFTVTPAGELQVGGVTLATFDPTGGTGSLFFQAGASQAFVNEAIQRIAYAHAGDDPPTSVTLRYVFVDGNSGAQGSGGSGGVEGSKTVDITPVDDASVARDDAFSTDEATTLNGSVFADNGAGPDVDPDDPLEVAEVNGSAANVGQQIALASGALLTLNADGTFAYDPNGAFDKLAAAGSGADTTQTLDSFTYALADGTAATVRVTVNGLDSDDVLAYLEGPETMTGGVGDDLYYVKTVGDRVIEAAGPSGGNDTVYAYVDFDLATDGQNVETVQIIGSGITVTGTGAANVLVGGAGQNTLVGGGGDDVYHVRNSQTVITEAAGAGGGNDAVYAYVDFDLSQQGGNVEQIVARGAGLTLTGNSGANTLVGGSDANTLVGGAGDDLYYVRNSDTEIVEAAGPGGGNDAVYAYVDFDLGQNGQNVETIIAQGSGITITGDGLANVLVGGTGQNTLVGGAGDDTYHVRNSATEITEAAGTAGGTADAVYAYVDFDLATNGANVEVIVASDAGLSIGGDAGANTLVGHAGGTTMTGGDGDDVYHVLSADSVVIETGGTSGGIDTIYAYASVNLALRGQNVERVDAVGSADIDIVGDGLANELIGNVGANMLTGGGGQDQFVFRANFGADTVTDFETGPTGDLLRFSTSAFATAGAAFAAAQDDGFGNVRIDAGGGDVVTLINVALADLRQDDFAVF